MESFLYRDLHINLDSILLSRGCFSHIIKFPLKVWPVVTNQAHIVLRGKEYPMIDAPHRRVCATTSVRKQQFAVIANK